MHCCSWIPAKKLYWCKRVVERRRIYKLFLFIYIYQYIYISVSTCLSIGAFHCKPPLDTCLTSALQQWWSTCTPSCTAGPGAHSHNSWVNASHVLTWAGFCLHFSCKWVFITSISSNLMLQELAVGRELAWGKKLPYACAGISKHSMDGALESRADWRSPRRCL